MARKRLSVAELRDLFESGAKPEDLDRIRSIEEFPVETTANDEGKGEDLPVEEEEEEEEDGEEQEEEQERRSDEEHEEGTGVAEDHDLLELQDSGITADREIYEVIFETDTNEGLGMVVQQQDEEMPGTNRVRERLVVEMITESGAAAQQGITEGSTLIEVNGVDVTEKSYAEALTLLKQPARPLALKFEKGLGVYTTQGYCFKAATGSLKPPKRFNAWKLRYYVLGGPVAGNNVLQLYKSKSDFDKVVVSVVSRRPVTVKFKAYLLTNDYNSTVLKQKRYDSRPAPLEFFSIRRPRARFNKVMHIARIPSDSSDGIRILHGQISETTTREGT